MQTTLTLEIVLLKKKTGPGPAENILIRCRHKTHVSSFFNKNRAAIYTVVGPINSFYVVKI